MEAFNVVKKKEVQRKAAELGRAQGPTAAADKVRLVNMDCRDWFQTAPDSAFDIVLTDPPDGMGADGFGKLITKTQPTSMMIRMKAGSFS